MSDEKKMGLVYVEAKGQNKDDREERASTFMICFATSIMMQFQIFKCKHRNAFQGGYAQPNESYMESANR